MLSNYKMPSTIKKKISRYVPKVSTSQDSGRRYGDFSEDEEYSRAFTNILFYIQKGCLSSPDLLTEILKQIQVIQSEANINFLIIPLTFGLDDEPFYNGKYFKNFEVLHRTNCLKFANTLFELSGTKKSQIPAIIPQLFPKSSVANMLSGGKTSVTYEDLLIIIGNKDEVFFAESLNRKINKYRKQILFVEIENENVNWYFKDLDKIKYVGAET